MRTVRWGDKQSLAVVIGSPPITTPELFRVTTTTPQVFKVLARVQVGNAANLGIQAILTVWIGLGSTVIEHPIGLLVSALNEFEFPAETISGRISTNAALANDNWTIEAIVAPFFPVGQFT